MAIRVAPGAADVPADLAGRFLVLVRGSTDTEAALAGLQAARADLLGLGPAVVSGVALSPDGPLLRVSSLEADDDVLQTIPDLLVAALDRAEVPDGTVELLEPIGALDQLDRTPSAAVLRLFPRPAGADGVIPPEWLEIATEWVLGDATGGETVGVRLLGATFEVATRDAAAALHAAVGGRAWCDLVHGRLDRRIRTASLTFGRAPHLALAAGGPGCNTTAMTARFELLQEVAREVGGAAYACVDLEETFASVGAGVPGTGWPARGGADPNAVVGQVGDVVVPDAFPFQILGPGHLRRFGSRGRDEIDGVPLDDGRVEVTLGELSDWMPRFDTRIDTADHACKELADLLVDDAQLAELVGARPAVAASDPLTTRGGPDLDHITLEALPHPRRGVRLTLLELASWLGHEAHSDVPRSVSPVLAAYARWYASGLDHDRRQELKPYATRLAGTRAPGLAPAPWRPLPPIEEARAWRAVDWLAREQSATWLAAAGLDTCAGQITKVRRRADGSHHIRQLRLLDASLAELAAAGRPSPADDAAWDDWERAAEASAWVAASEAAWVGIPDAVASAAELRALELVRGGAAAAVDQVRAAALAAAAEDAWRLAGIAAAAAVDARLADPDAPEAVAAVPLATAWERARQGAASRAGVDRDAFEQAMEQAEAAARGLLVDLIDGGDPPGDALQVARRAAETSAGGALWSSARELAQGVVGDATWAAAERAATEAVDRVVRCAPQVVERAVLVAVAREVSGLAARTAIRRGGASTVDSALAALRPAATALLEALLTTK